jgi:hypothetical protein
MSILSCPRFTIVLAMAATLSVTMHAQSVQGTEPKPGKLVGTVTDFNGDPVPNATVVLDTPGDDDRRTLVTPEREHLIRTPGSRPVAPANLSK